MADQQTTGDTPDSVCEVFVNGVSMARVKMDGNSCAFLLSQGISPLPHTLRHIADQLEATDA